MSEAPLNITVLLAAIEHAFPIIEMLPHEELVMHNAGCLLCSYLRRDLEGWRDKEITRDFVRHVSLELSCLSAKSWTWIMPHYLRLCLTLEGDRDPIEFERLIYSLGPKEEFQTEASESLSALSSEQIECLVHVFDWCLVQQYWRECCKFDIERAQKFLQTLIAARKS